MKTTKTQIKTAALSVQEPVARISIFAACWGALFGGTVGHTLQAAATCAVLVPFVLYAYARKAQQGRALQSA